MTTLVALNTRDALVMGCDSLGTMTRRLVDPFDLADYFDDESKVKIGSDGQPLLDNFMKIYSKSLHVPYNYMTHVDKLFSLESMKMGVMFAGEAAIGNRTVKNLLSEFKSTEVFLRSAKANHTLKSVAKILLRFLWDEYVKEHPEEHRRPELELMLGGYDRQKHTPGIIRIYVHENRCQEPEYDFNVYFGGQSKEIQRWGLGTDTENKAHLSKRTEDLLKRYHTLLCQQLEANGVKNPGLKSPEEFGDELHLFNDWSLDVVEANWAAFSEQNAIECVSFLVDMMIRSQQFGTEIPTVGGNIHIAVIKKASGFTFVSERVWRHEEHEVEVRE